MDLWLPLLVFLEGLATSGCMRRKEIDDEAPSQLPVNDRPFEWAGAVTSAVAYRGAMKSWRQL